MSTLVAACPQLSTLDLNNCTLLTQTTLEAIAAHCPRLQSLDLGGQPGSGSGSLRPRPSRPPDPLTHCGVGSGQRLATDAGLLELAAACHGLRSLNIRYCSDVSAEAVERIKDLLCANVQVRQ